MTNIKSIFLFISLFLTLISCNRDDSPEYSSTDKNNVTVSFENTIDNVGSITLNQTILTSTSNQKHTFSALKYIVSNIILIKTDGSEVKYNYDNPDKGAFIVDQSEGTSEHMFTLSDIPAGDYKQIKFGLGISPSAYTLGQSGQALFWDKAKTSGMSWSWASGYKFVRFEGNYAAPGSNIDATNPSEYMFHAGNIGNPTVSNTPDVYKVITLDLPTTAKVRNTISPTIHIMASINKWLSGTNTLVIDQTNEMAMHPSIDIVQKGCANLANAFSVEHVHND